MKSLAVLLLLLVNQAWSFAPSFKYDGRPEIDVVLGSDKTVPSYENPFRFPCTQFQVRVYCEKTGLEFADPVCARTLWVDRLAHKMEISCLINLKKVVLATADSRTRATEAAPARFDYFPLKFTKFVSFNRVSNRDLGIEIVVNPNAR